MTASPWVFPVFALWAFGALATLFSLMERENEMLEAGHRWNPPLRFWVLHSTLWFVELVLYTSGLFVEDMRAYKAFKRACWPGKHAVRR